MGTPKICRFCCEPLPDCVCDDSAVTIPEGAGPMLARMFGPGPQEPGPPYTHVLRFPEEPAEGEPYAPPPPSFTVERGA